MSLWSYQLPRELSDEQYACWQTLLEQRTGICFLQHKSILQKGLSQRMREVGVDNYEEYFQQVSKEPEGAIEWAQLVDKISVKETSFFREPFSFDLVREYLVERLRNVNNTKDYTLDIWSVGCSTGEEAYSLAILADEAIEAQSVKAYVGVMATDISPTALAFARSGRYGKRKLNALPQTIKQKYFRVSDSQHYEVEAELRQRLCFVQGNIVELSKVPKIEMDVIFCQNVLVYFRRNRRIEVLNNLVRHLKPGGLLVIGPGEVSGWRHPNVRRTKNEKVQVYVRQTA